MKTDRVNTVVVSLLKVVRKKMEHFLLPNMIEISETNRMSHFPPYPPPYSKKFIQGEFV